MSGDDDEHDPAVAALRARLRAADADIRIPEHLRERLLATASDAADRKGRGPKPTRQEVLRARARGLRTPALALAATVAVVALGVAAWTGFGPGGVRGVPGPAAQGQVVLRVHNAESACGDQRTLECALRVARSPYGTYAAQGNAAGRVWNGDAVVARCVVTDGTLVTDESGLSSTRWYAVRTPEGGSGWLPGVRTRNTVEVRLCAEEGQRPGR